VLVQIVANNADGLKKLALLCTTAHDTVLCGASPGHVTHSQATAAQVYLKRADGELVRTILREASASERRVLAAGLAATLSPGDVRRCALRTQ
jgi:hypothetical protein